VATGVVDAATGVDDDQAAHSDEEAATGVDDDQAAHS